MSKWSQCFPLQLFRFFLFFSSIFLPFFITKQHPFAVGFWNNFGPIPYKTKHPFANPGQFPQTRMATLEWASRPTTIHKDPQGHGHKQYHLKDSSKHTQQKMWYLFYFHWMAQHFIGITSPREYKECTQHHPPRQAQSTTTTRPMGQWKSHQWTAKKEPDQKRHEDTISSQIEAPKSNKTGKGQMTQQARTYNKHCLVENCQQERSGCLRTGPRGGGP